MLNQAAISMVNNNENYYFLGGKSSAAGNRNKKKMSAMQLGSQNKIGAIPNQKSFIHKDEQQINSSFIQMQDQPDLAQEDPLDALMEQ